MHKMKVPNNQNIGTFKHFKIAFNHFLTDHIKINHQY